MTNEEIKAKIENILIEKFGVDVEDAKNEHLPFLDMGLDSLEQIEFVMALEDEFDTEISDEDFDRWDRVDWVVKGLELILRDK